MSYDENRWFSQYKKLAAQESFHVLLESGKTGRYSIIGLNPFAKISGQRGKLSIVTHEETIIQEGNIIDLFQQWMKQFYIDVPKNELPDFVGGAIGYFSYDCVRYIEKLPTIAKDDLEVPELYFLVFFDVFVFDHKLKQFWLITIDEETRESEAEERLRHYEQMWNNSHSEAEVQEPICKRNPNPLYEVQEESSFLEAAAKVKRYIEAGDVYQVNLSIRKSAVLTTPSIQIYEKLREINPSPYMAYFHTPDFQIASSSPELLVKVKDGKVSTRPIGGTRPRGKNKSEDERFLNELLTDEKEQAEHVMLVDIERNDIGKVCEVGTVEVNEFKVIETYSHVQHLVSNIQGKLAQEKDVFDVVKAVFPGGSITGAPKVRTMEIIEELEPFRRGIYTGSIGWIGFQGDMELNIVIRTLLAKDGIGHVQAGAGIVSDSNPKAEYEECIKKAEAILRATELSEQKKVEWS